MDQFELFPGEPESPVYELEGFSAMTPDQQEQVRRYFRVNVAAQDMSDFKDRQTPGGAGGLWDQTMAATDEFARNFTGGLGDYAGAAVSYLTEAFPGRQPMEGLDFFERRDALRTMRDNRAERIPDWVDNTASLAGVLGLGSSPTVAGARNAGFGAAPVAAANLPRGITSLKDAALVGGAVGAGEGLGTSEATTAGGVATDTGVGAAFGSAAGAAADLVLDKVVGGAFRKAFAKPGDGSRAAYDAQLALGIPPSVGSIGNRTAGMIENSFAEAPVTSAINAMLPQGRLVGRSAAPTQQTQIDLMEGALQREVTGPRRPQTPVSGMPPATTDARLAVNTENLARYTRGRLDEEMAKMEGAYEALVPPGTPTNIQATREFPTVLRREHHSETLAQQADRDIAAINQNEMFPVDPMLDRQLVAQKTTYEKNIEAAEKQLAKLGDKPRSGTQRSNLRRTIKTNQDRLADVNRRIYENFGPSWKAVREERSLLGKDAARGGLMGGQVAGRLRDTMAGDLAAGADRVRPGAGQEFLDMIARESEIYDAQDIVKRYAEGRASTNTNYLRQAVMGGNWEELDVLLSKATPDEKLAFKADLIDSLGRTPESEFSAAKFSKNWRNMPDEAKQRLVGDDPEAWVLMDTLAEVSEDFTARGRLSNHSNTAAAGSVLAGFGAAVVLPGKVIPFLTVTLGVDRVLVSEAMAKAVAGNRTDLGQLLRRSITNYAGTGDQNNNFGPQ